MAKKRGTRADAWGTSEELLLACAVSRHGTKSWDSIAMEVQKRTSIFHSLSSQHCIHKFKDLKSRFTPLNDATASLVLIIDELRKIRVEELRREVQRRDVSILSLELKVKKLEEERDRSAKEDTYLAREKKVSHDTVAGKTAVGEESGDERENPSFNESNSTGQQKEQSTTTRFQKGTVNAEPAVQPDPQIQNENEPDLSESDPIAVWDWSCNGKSENVDDEENRKIETEEKESRIKLIQTTDGLVELNELGELFRKFKREEKQSSDVQSSALSLTTRKRRRRGVGVGGGSGGVGSSSGDSGGGSGLGVASSRAEEPEAGDEVSPVAITELMNKLIGTVQSHRLGSIFEQRLGSQESRRYKNLIRQHIDLQTIQSRIGEGVYSSSIQKFFRDLLLLFNNGVVFFKKNAPEYLAAIELRAQVSKEMAKNIGHFTEAEVRQQSASFSKPNNLSSAVVVCDKGNSAKANKKGKEAEEEKPKVNNPKKIEHSFEDNNAIRRKRSKDERSVSSTKSADTKHNNALEMEMKVERKGNNNTSKRQGASSFLKRMKQNSPIQVEEEEQEEEEDKGKKGGKDRNTNNITERVTRSSKGRNGKNESGGGKRRVGRGRPPKEKRDNGGSDVGTPRKRCRR